MNDVQLTAVGAHGAARVDVDVANGGRISQISLDGVSLLVAPPPVDERDATSVAWGSYPMAPWAGRVRHGEFSFFGIDHQLTLNQDDSGTGAPGRQHAMHGTVMSKPWEIEDQTSTTLSLRTPLTTALTTPLATRVADSGWSCGGVAHQRIEVMDGQLRCDLSVTVDHDAPPFPAEIGWHPWWTKPDRLTFHPDAMYELDAIGLPTGRLVAPTESPWDDCFVNTAPVTLHYDRDAHPDITVSSDCDHWVVFDGPAHATCVEPQSGPPDAFNVRPQLVTATHPLRRTMNISW